MYLRHGISAGTTADPWCQVIAGDIVDYGVPFGKKIRSVSLILVNGTTPHAGPNAEPATVANKHLRSQRPSQLLASHGGCVCADEDATARTETRTWGGAWGKEWAGMVCPPSACLSVGQDEAAAVRGLSGDATQGWAHTYEVLGLTATALVRRLSKKSGQVAEGVSKMLPCSAGYLGSGPWDSAVCVPRQSRAADKAKGGPRQRLTAEGWSHPCCFSDVLERSGAERRVCDLQVPCHCGHFCFARLPLRGRASLLCLLLLVRLAVGWLLATTTDGFFQPTVDRDAALDGPCAFILRLA